MKAGLLAVFLGCIAAYGQDAATMAAQQAMQANQQAMQASQLATQQAIQANQQAMQQTQQANQQAMNNAQQNAGPLIYLTRMPAFSVKPGAVAPGTKVRIKCPTHYAVIYYTTDGWTPTTASARYTGPLPIDETTHLRAMAVAPNMLHSLIASADYVVKGTAAPAPQAALITNGVLYAGTPLRLVTGSEIDSKTAQVGDKIDLLLDQDVKVGDAVVAARGTPVEATITQADRAGHAGTPGDLAFAVHSLSVGGKQIPLEGGETLEGVSRYKMRGLLFVPVVGPASLLIRGEEAEIKPGMALAASVAADTQLRP